MSRKRGFPSCTRGFVQAGVVALALVLISGCALLSNVSFYGNLLRANRAGVRFRRTYEHLELSVPFSSRSDVTLDVYTPADGDRHPVLIFIHGGGWNSYDKELFAPVAMELIPEEMVVVIPDYTLYPDATYRQMAREVADATAWVFRNISRYRGDPDRVYLSGHSAGAHLSGLVAYDSIWLAEAGHSPQELRGWIGLSGVYDIGAHAAGRSEQGLDSPVMIGVAEGPANFASASAITYADGFGARRAHLIHGTLDATVPIHQSEEFARVLDRAGVRTELLVYPDAGHSDFLFGALGDPDARVIADIARIVRQ